MMPDMAVSAHVVKPLRVLLSEGNSTSAREAITILGLAGHIVEVCDPSPYCFARFSRFVAKFHRCPSMRDDPAGFLTFVEKLLAARHFDVLLPIHEQGFLFARVAPCLADRVGLALPSFANYRTAHSKVGFSRLLDRLGLPQPPTRIVESESELRDAVRFPAVVKTSVGTASRGIWFVRNDGDLEGALRELNGQDLSIRGAFADEVLVQEFVAGTTEKAQAVFCRGELIGFHAFRQIAGGAGGGEAIKQSVSRPEMRGFVATIGRELAWHGALSVDYIMADDDTAPRLIDCNPRLVEPMSAYLAGLDLVSLLLRVSQGEVPASAGESRAGVRTHLAMQALLGCAARGGTRRDIFRECWRLLTGAEPYADSAEELTPVRRDWVSAVPLTMVAIFLLIAPRRAAALARGGWGAHLLDPKSIRRIASEDFYNG
ncbi:ATP-grasp domain-containing protein [Bradyrhizobium lablabi]|uniref:ATP-grasp domain-containing protein n=1 Tax=Bradyrhizobium lablabi TaxID=722472 RepID=A0A1M6WBB6_9BRAD|nr:ATP-grasp domain-containing protein [Bradyrhizobium lablabi]SHK91062.1 ATP-grasp domain-containing protein [Bradyrhizobium lablabi]